MPKPPGEPKPAAGAATYMGFCVATATFTAAGRPMARQEPACYNPPTGVKMSTPLSFKGVGEVILITIPEGDWGEAQADLLQALIERHEFFQGAHVSFQVGERRLGAAEIGMLRDQLAEHGIMMVGMISTSPATRAAAADLGLALEAEPPRPAAIVEEAPLDTELEGEPAVLVRRTLRSGHVLRYPGHIMVIGDVNPGAQIIAGGNIFVWGRLRGVVHAGAAGDQSAVVCALDLAPTQLRIAGQIAISPKRKRYPGPEMALIKEGQLVAQSWNDERPA
jgi:septum site-determining protein MinC